MTVERVRDKDTRRFVAFPETADNERVLRAEMKWSLPRLLLRLDALHLGILKRPIQRAYRGARRWAKQLDDALKADDLETIEKLFMGTEGKAIGRFFDAIELVEGEACLSRDYGVVRPQRDGEIINESDFDRIECPVERQRENAQAIKKPRKSLRRKKRKRTRARELPLALGVPGRPIVTYDLAQFAEKRRQELPRVTWKAIAKEWTELHPNDPATAVRARAARRRHFGREPATRPKKKKRL